jgi:2-polyprenyl-3-methyl-5-hydroxy-6-metoxy-1,4-benzoquinol methylase
MDQPPKPKSPPLVGHYDANYGNFQTDLYAQVRREAFGEDIGQQSWLTSSEQDRFLGWLNLSSGKKLLDVGCGAGGPALRIAASTGCSVVGIDVHEQAIATANSLAAQRGLTSRAEFRVSDATGRLPLPDSCFDAITCIDAINHLPNRRGVIAEWSRLLKRNGRLLFTDPVIVTGPLTNAEIAIRSSIGFFLFVPPNYDESLIAACGLRLLVCEDLTANLAEVAQRRLAARASRSTALRATEGDQTYDGQQEFLAVASRIAREGRLSRFVFVAEKFSGSGSV